MDNTVQTVAALAGNLVSSGKEETKRLESLKSELTAALEAGNYDLERVRKSLRSAEKQQKILKVILVILLLGFVLLWLRRFG